MNAHQLGSIPERFHALVVWFVGVLERFEKLEEELEPYRRKAASNSLTGKDRRAFLRLLDQQEELQVEQAEKLSSPLLGSMGESQRALLKQLVEMTKGEPTERRVRTAGRKRLG